LLKTIQRQFIHKNRSPVGEINAIKRAPGYWANHSLAGKAMLMIGCLVFFKGGVGAWHTK
jgi:hypothetical protein